MLGAIKLPSSGASQNKFFNSSYVEVIGPNYLEVCGAVEPQWGRNQLCSSVYANQTLRHVQETITYGFKTASTVIENLNTINEHHLMIFFASG